MSDNYENYKVGDKFKINDYGQTYKYNVIEAHGKEVVLVLARIDEDNVNLFIVESEYRGQTSGCYMSCSDYEYLKFCKVVKIDNDKTEYVSTLEPPLEVTLTIEDNLTKLNNLLKEVSKCVVTSSLRIQSSSDTIKYTLEIDNFEFEFKDINGVINKLNQFLTFAGE